ncbi:MAG: c-type cytochrome [Wenzhouxiangellaceae bacterium]
MKSISTVIKTLVTATVLIVLLVLGFAWSGLYPVAAGSGHSAPVAWLLETVRERSVAARAADLTVPNDLDSSERIAAGAAHYDSMCAGCHGKPGQEPADSFDPKPPALYRHQVEARKAFWTVKHGLKMTAMPSHRDHSDEENWDTVAFVRALPDMSAEAYRNLTADATHDHGEGDGHDHGSGSSDAQTDSRASDDSDEHGADDEGHQDAADSGGHRHDMQADSPEQVIDGFRHALVEGRREAALTFFHPRATIIESGHVQSVEEYAAGHLGSDMAFLSEIAIEQLSRDTQLGKDQATVETRSRFRGQVNDQSIDLESIEFATLIETDEGWRISQVAWSSQLFSGGEPPEAGQNEDAHSHPEGDDNHEH